MANDYFTRSGAPRTSSDLESDKVRNEFRNVEASFGLLAPMDGHGGEVVKINAGGTAQESISIVDLVEDGLQGVAEGAPVALDFLPFLDASNGNAHRRATVTSLSGEIAKVMGSFAAADAAEDDPLTFYDRSAGRGATIEMADLRGTVLDLSPLAATANLADNDIVGVYSQGDSEARSITIGNLRTLMQQGISIAGVTFGIAFPAAPSNGDRHYFNGAAVNLAGYVDGTGMALNSAGSGDIAEYDAPNNRWVRVFAAGDLTGVLTELTAGTGLSGGGGSGGVTVNLDLNSLGDLAAPADADRVPIIDASDGNDQKKATIANLRSALLNLNSLNVVAAVAADDYLAVVDASAGDASGKALVSTVRDRILDLNSLGSVNAMAAADEVAFVDISDGRSSKRAAVSVLGTRLAAGWDSLGAENELADADRIVFWDASAGLGKSIRADLFRAAIHPTWIVNSTAPASPSEGDGWYARDADQLRIWNGTAWKAASGTDLADLPTVTQAVAGGDFAPVVDVSDTNKSKKVTLDALKSFFLPPDVSALGEGEVTLQVPTGYKVKIHYDFFAGKNSGGHLDVRLRREVGGSSSILASQSVSGGANSNVLRGTFYDSGVSGSVRYYAWKSDSDGSRWFGRRMCASVVPAAFSS